MCQGIPMWVIGRPLARMLVRLSSHAVTFPKDWFSRRTLEGALQPDTKNLVDRDLGCQVPSPMSVQTRPESCFRSLLWQLTLLQILTIRLLVDRSTSIAGAHVIRMVLALCGQREPYTFLHNLRWISSSLVLNQKDRIFKVIQATPATLLGAEFRR